MKKIIIDNIETDYEINELGEIYSYKTNKILSGSILNTGYRMVRLTINGQKKSYAVHRLVAEAFIPNPENKPCVDHINTIREDNRVENLRWVTKEENNNNPLTKKKYSKNHREQTGEKNPMYGKYCKGVYCIELNISSQSICNALNGFSKSAGRHPITNEKLHWKYV